MTALLIPALPSSPSTGGRDPAHALYEHAAGLLESAQSLEAAAQSPGSIAALAPTIACVETSLTALAAALEQLRSHTLERLSDPALADDHVRRMALALERLAGVLEQGAHASEHALASIEPMHNELRVS